MSHGIKKETYINSNEKTTKALTFDLLDNLYIKMDKMTEFQSKQIEICSKRFLKIENKKKRDTAMSMASGFGGGYVAVITIWLKKYFDGSP